MAYSFIWRTTCGAIGGLGIALGLIVLPPDLLIPFVLLTIVVSLTAAVGHTSTPTEQRTSSQAGRLAALPLLALLALAGLTFALGPAVLLLLLTLLATSPPAVRWYRDSPSRPEALDESATTTAQLCQQWHDTFEDLHHAPTPAARLRVVKARQRCLDELERRDPNGLNAWLASTASPAGDPTRYLRMDRSNAPPTDTA
ncbi:hypothetical protein [Kribbella sp. NPDC051620]|uniref:hypothetical protein n=1 Tax=Kribbella sp. NPDC051620 TaxID=3364120 RepID=UPI0037A68F7A